MLLSFMVSKSVVRVFHTALHQITGIWTQIPTCCSRFQEAISNNSIIHPHSDFIMSKSNPRCSRASVGLSCGISNQYCLIATMYNTLPFCRLYWVAQPECLDQTVSRPYHNVQVWMYDISKDCYKVKLLQHWCCNARVWVWTTIPECS